MATNTFDRKLEITDPESVKTLIKVMLSDAPKDPPLANPYTDAERERSDLLFRQCVSRSRR